MASFSAGFAQGNSYNKRRNQLDAGVRYKTDTLFQRAFLLLLLLFYIHIPVPHYDHLHLHILINSIFFSHAVSSLSPHAAFLHHITFPCHLLITLPPLHRHPATSFVTSPCFAIFFVSSFFTALFSFFIHFCYLATLSVCFSSSPFLLLGFHPTHTPLPSEPTSKNEEAEFSSTLLPFSHVAPP